MRTVKIVSCLFLLLTHFLLNLHSAELDIDDQLRAAADDLQYVKGQKKLVAKGNVVISHGNTELTADEVNLDVDSKVGQAQGHVVIRHAEQGVLSGPYVTYDFDDKQGLIENGRFSQYPWFGYAEEIKQISANEVRGKNAYFTSCPLPHPHYDLHAKDFVLYPEDKLIARNITFRVLGVPVFWWPYLQIPLNSDNFLNIVPGYSDEFGAYVLVSKGFSISENIKAVLHLDWYKKRGFGAGMDIDYKYDRLGFGEVKIYGIRDKDAPDERAVNPFEDKNRKEDERGRVSWKHKMRLDPKTSLQWQWHELSDENFLQDFFEGEHREEVDPQSFITLTRNSELYSFLAHFEKRTNRFSSVAEKLPELIFTWLRRPLFGSNFYYTNQEGFVNFNQTNRFAPDGANTVQFFTDHEVSYPARLFQFYNFVPFINMRDDFYTKNRIEKDATNRFLMGAGFDLSTRFYKTWDIQRRVMGMNIGQVRHILEPLIQYNSIRYANEKPGSLINTGRGDNLGYSDLMTFGVENRLQTKRMINGVPRRVDLVSFNAFLDLSFGPGNSTLDSYANKFTAARFETILRPYDWLSFRMDTRYDFLTDKLGINNIDAIFTPQRLFLAISHRFLSDKSPNGSEREDSNQLTLDTMYSLNERWAIGGYARYEFTDSQFEEWELRAQRDLHDWWLDFGLNVRNSERNSSDSELNKEFFVQLRLKAYPAIDLKSGHRATFSEPRIGETVTGSDEAPLGDWIHISPEQRASAVQTRV